jgi:hypothetical protein
LVPGGGVSPGGDRWIACRPGFFLPVRVLSRLFRRLFLRDLEGAFAAGRLQFFSALQSLADRPAFRRHLAPASNAEWVVYAKPPFAGPRQVLAYIGGYAHRVAISNHRLLAADDDKVSFRWKDYRRKSRHGVMTLAADEFIRRFLIHVLPDGFQRIRYYGFLCNRQRAAKLARCRELLAMVPAAPTPGPGAKDDYRDLHETLTGRSLTLCPACAIGHMRVREILPQPKGRHCVWDSS